MKKSALLYVSAIMLICTFLGSSCKKRTVPLHPNAPTPNNVRMVGFTKITTIQMTVPVASMPSTINENYRFYYDENNRVVKMIYTGNDSFQIHKTILFTYKGDSIFKKTINALNNDSVQTDTFIMNSNGQITTAYTPFLETTFEYYGNLLARTKRVGTSYRGITMTSSSTYTSHVGDLLKHNMDGKLEIDFTNFTTPLSTVKIVTYPKASDTEFNNDHSGTTYTRVPYHYNPMYVYVKDPTDVKDSLNYPGLFWVGESYYFYTEDANRDGDYMMLESFVMYGKNIYRNKHLVKSMTSSSRHAHITYNIDAKSNIIQTKVAMSDSVLNKFTYTYDIQYETY